MKEKARWVTKLREIFVKLFGKHLAILTTLGGAALMISAGWLCLNYAFAGAGALARLSYDLPFVLRNRETPEVCIVYMDDNAARSLGQGFGIWDRKVHAALVRRLTEAGARAIFFDIVFSWSDPAADPEFAAAIKEHGRVFLGASLELGDSMGGVQERVVAPTPMLRRAAAGWGVLAFRPLDADYGVRFLYTGTEDVPSAAWRMAEKLGAQLPDNPAARTQPRWLNYYGPVGCFIQEPYDRAIRADGVPAGFFKDKIVFIGSRSTTGTLGLGKDDFAHPHTRWTRKFASGVEMHATAFLNLFRHEWLERWDERWENCLIFTLGLGLAVFLPRYRFRVSLALSVSAILVVTLCAGWMLRREHIWFSWCVPVLVQIPLALVYSIATRYFLVERRRLILRHRFEAYVPPETVKLIEGLDLDPKPGGSEVVATVMFTDLENFSTLSETLRPSELSQLLTEYFTRTTNRIASNKGTVIKFIGDAVLAVWGAPIKDPKLAVWGVPIANPDHCGNAVLAAWALHEAAREPITINGRSFNLRTRVGLHTGVVLVGNLGSEQRFDYTVIGDTVNFASRLEELNKQLATNILISEATHDGLDNRFSTRCLGRFKVVGKTAGVLIYELLGPALLTHPGPWFDPFACGLDAFEQGNFEAATRHMREALKRSQRKDGPARFYLRELLTLRKKPTPPNWNGMVKLTSK